jgi:hypothetical protein
MIVYTTFLVTWLTPLQMHAPSYEMCPWPETDDRLRPMHVYRFARGSHLWTDYRRREHVYGLLSYNNRKRCALFFRKVRSSMTA